MKKLMAIAISATMAAGTCGAATPKGINVANLDPAVAPGTDFYEYACGGWMKANPLKPEYSRFGTFDELGELNNRQVRGLVEELSKTAQTPGTNAQRIADLYAQGLDSVRLNREGAEPIRKDLKTIAGVSREGIMPLIAALPGAGGFFVTGVEPDMKDANVNVMAWMQGGLGLGDRDYYIVDGDNEKAVLEAYRKCLTTLAKLAGYSDREAARIADNSIKVETELARVAKSRTELRDPQASYNPMTMQKLMADYPAVNLKGYFKAQGLDNVDKVIIGQPTSLEAVNKILASTDLQVLRDYLTAQYLSNAAPYLSDDFNAAVFALQQVITGVQQQKPRWKRALAVPNGILGEALGELYVAKYFPPTSKAKMQVLVSNLQQALGQHIDRLTWMSDATKAKAHEKLDAFTVKIGYPDKWKDYSSLVIDPKDSYWHNIQRSIDFANKDNLNDYGKSVDKDRWYMSPQTVNAYYNPPTNEICFPAGILQPPFFDPEADDAVNYGAIGVVIGHEMTHGFDDQGRQYDKDGNLNDWWTAEDAAAFTKLAEELAAQFDSIVVIDDVHANGHLTLGENIADQGGLRVAHTAYHNAVKGQPATDIDGFSPDQRFYLGYANVWAANIRPAEILRRTKIDPHSLGRYRVNATLRNIAPFFEAFSITEGQPMFRPESERVVIW